MSGIVIDGYKGHENVPSNVKSVRFHPSVTKIGNGAFEGCIGLREVVLNDSLREIGDEAFHGCSSLQSINFPSTVTKIGASAFSGCSSLDAVVLYEGLASIDVGVFAGCVALQSIIFPSTITEIGSKAFHGCTNLRDVVLNDGLKKIHSSSFESCMFLQSITIPSSVDEIGTRVFARCVNLREVVLNDGIKRIGWYPNGSGSFSNCTSLQSITLPSTVEQIGTITFNNCKNLQEVVIYNEKIQIGNKAFTNCSSLERFKFPSLWARLDRIIQAGQRDIEAKLDNIPAVEWRAGELDIPAVHQEIERNWGMETLVKVDEEKLSVVKGLISYHEMKEATTLYNMSTLNKNNDTSNDDGVCEINDKLQNMNTADIVEETVSVCANCGKKGDNVNNICNKCKRVMYCNAACKKKHRHKHKKECEEYVKLLADKRNEVLTLEAEKHDEELFKTPPAEDCPICFERIPNRNSGQRYNACCGKVICSGCVHSPLYDDQGNEVDNEKCPFCRTPHPDTQKEHVRRMLERVKAGDPMAIHNIGMYYRDGTYGFPQDYTKALELYHRAGEIGDANAYNSLSCCYNNGIGVEVDEKKAEHYCELAAIGGSATARYNLGNKEYRAGNMDRALKHFMIAVRGGYHKPLQMIQELYLNGYVTKEDYTKALQAYQAYLGEIKSDQRDKAAAADEQYRYY